MTKSVIVPGMSRRAFWIAYFLVVTATIIYLAFDIKKSADEYENPSVTSSLNKVQYFDFPAIEVCATDPSYQLDCGKLPGSCLCYPFPTVAGLAPINNKSSNYNYYYGYYGSEESPSLSPSPMGNDYALKRRGEDGNDDDDDDKQQQQRRLQQQNTRRFARSNKGMSSNPDGEVDANVFHETLMELKYEVQSYKQENLKMLLDLHDFHGDDDVDGDDVDSKNNKNTNKNTNKNKNNNKKDEEDNLSNVLQKEEEEFAKKTARIKMLRDLLRAKLPKDNGYCHPAYYQYYQDYATPGQVPIHTLTRSNTDSNPFFLDLLPSTIVTAITTVTASNSTNNETASSSPSQSQSPKPGAITNTPSASATPQFNPPPPPKPLPGALGKEGGNCIFQFTAPPNVCDGKNPTNSTYIKFSFTNIYNFSSSTNDMNMYFFAGLEALMHGGDPNPLIDNAINDLIDYYPNTNELLIAQQYNDFAAAYSSSLVKEYFPDGVSYTSTNSNLTVLLLSYSNEVGFSANVSFTCSLPKPCQPGCAPYEIGDGHCNLECLSQSCAQDTPFPYPSTRPSDCAAALNALATNGPGSCLDQNYNIQPSPYGPSCSIFNFPKNPFRINPQQTKTNIVVANVTNQRLQAKNPRIKSKAYNLQIVLGGTTTTTPRPYAYQGYTFKVYHPIQHRRLGQTGGQNKGLKYALPVNQLSVVTITQSMYTNFYWAKDEHSNPVIRHHNFFSYDASLTSVPIYIPPPVPIAVSTTRGGNAATTAPSQYAVPCSTDGSDGKTCTTTILKFQISSYTIQQTSEFVPYDAQAVIGSIGGFWSLVVGFLAVLFPVIGVEQKRFIFDKTQPLPEELYVEEEEKKNWKMKLWSLITCEFFEGWQLHEISYLQNIGLQKKDLKKKEVRMSKIPSRQSVNVTAGAGENGGGASAMSSVDVSEKTMV